MALSRVVYEPDDRNSVENRKIFQPPCFFCVLAEGASPWNWVSVLGVKKLE